MCRGYRDRRHPANENARTDLSGGRHTSRRNAGLSARTGGETTADAQAPWGELGDRRHIETTRADRKASAVCGPRNLCPHRGKPSPGHAQRYPLANGRRAMMKHAHAAQTPPVPNHAAASAFGRQSAREMAAGPVPPRPVPVRRSMPCRLRVRRLPHDGGGLAFGGPRPERQDRAHAEDGFRRAAARGGCQIAREARPRAAERPHRDNRKIARAIIETRSSRRTGILWLKPKAAKARNPARSRPMEPTWRVSGMPPTRRRSRIDKHMAGPQTERKAGTKSGFGRGPA